MWRSLCPLLALVRFCRICVCSAAPSPLAFFAIVLGGGIQFGERGNAEVLVEA